MALYKRYKTLEQKIFIYAIWVAMAFTISLFGELPQTPPQRNGAPKLPKT
nr:hypothetical protein [Streptococcus gallolyticus]